MHSLDMHNVYMSSKYDGFKMIIRNGMKKKAQQNIQNFILDGKQKKE